MRPVHRVEFVTDDPIQPSSPSAAAMESMPDLVFPMDHDETVKTPLPFEMSAAAAASTVDAVDRLLAPKSEAELMVGTCMPLVGSCVEFGPQSAPRKHAPASFRAAKNVLNAPC